MVSADSAHRNDRPVIRCGAELHLHIADAIAALALDPDLYVRDRALVFVARASSGTAPEVLPHTVATIRARLCEFAKFEKFDQKRMDWVAALPPDQLTKAVLEDRRWTGLRQLAGIAESPFMRPDGSILETPGYDPITEFLYAPARPFPRVPETPTQDECAEALRFLWVELCFDFPFRGMGYPDPSASDPDGVLRFLLARDHADAWGIPAAIMTMLARPAINGSTPAIVFDASTPGSGKGLQVDLSCIVALGRIPSKLTWPNRGKETDADLEKMLGGEARGGAVCTILDEITGDFGGPALNKVLTCDGWTKMRILGKSETPTLRWVSIVLGAGNNITHCDNTHRRMLMPRLEPPVEKPEERTGFRRDADEQKAWAKTNRGELVVAALTVLRGYVCAGRPDVGSAIMGGFEPWCKLVPRAIRWAGGGDFLGCRPTADPEARNEEREAISAVLDAIERLAPHQGGSITVGRLLDALYPASNGEPGPDDGFGDAREAIEALTRCGNGRPKSKALGDRLKTWKRRPIGNRTLDVDSAKARSGVALWKVTTK